MFFLLDTNVVSDLHLASVTIKPVKSSAGPRPQPPAAPAQAGAVIQEELYRCAGLRLQSKPNRTAEHKLQNIGSPVGSLLGDGSKKADNQDQGGKRGNGADHLFRCSQTFPWNHGSAPI